MNTYFARRMRKEPTKEEYLLWWYLQKRRMMGFKFRRQQPIDYFIVDFVCFEKRLIIEVDGGHHASRREYDRTRQTYLEENGFRVIRFWNNDVLKNTKAVLDKIYEALLVADLTPTLPSPVKGEE